jgi:hypothetical protein
MNVQGIFVTATRFMRGVVMTLFCFAIGVILAQTLTNVDVQDAYQYRLNLESGSYDERDSWHIWPLIIVFLSLYIPDYDPFILIGSTIAALFFFLGLKAQVGWGRWIIFVLLLVMPLMALNYVQVLRQGMAVALIIAALMVDSFWAMSLLLGLAAMLHVLYLPFIALTLLRFCLFPSSVVSSGAETTRRDAKVFDLFVFIFMPLAFVAFMCFGPEHIMQKYFVFDLANVKRLVASFAILALIFLVYPVGNQRITLFTTYFGLAVAFALPFQNDYTRINTAIFPLLVFSALLCGNRRRSYYALLICFVLTLYIELRLEYS